MCFPAGTYSGNVTASVAGQTWQLDDAAQLNGAITISGVGVRIVGGRIVRPTSDRWAPSVSISADDATVQAVDFRNGGVGINVNGRDRAKILSNTFVGLSGSAISIWGNGVGADSTLIQGNTIVQSITYQVSPITSRGNESGSHGGVQNSGTIIRSNRIDQGQGSVGWFGIELKQSAGAVIESNSIKGGSVLLSLPETDRAVVRHNTFDLRGSPYWGVEVANAYDVTVDANTFVGSGSTGGDHAISLNSGSLRTLARGNRVSNVRTFFDVSGDWHVVTDNCFSDVANEYEYRSSGGSNITFARNGSC